MENLRPKIKLKPASKSKTTRNGQSGVNSESFPCGYVALNAIEQHGDGYFPILNGVVKRKRVKKAGCRREEHQYESSPGKIYGVPSVHVEEEDISGYDDSEDRVEDNEDLRIGNGTHYIYNAASKPDETRNRERVQYRQGSLRVKFKPSKFRKISSNHSENQVKYDDDKNNSISAFSARQEQNPYVESISEYHNLSSTPDMHTARSECSGTKLSILQSKPLRSLDRINTPKQMRSDRSSERSSIPQQSEHVESFWKSENQRIKALEIPEGQHRKDGRHFFAVEKGGSFFSQYNKK